MATFCNIISNVRSPTKQNQNEFITLTSATTGAWEVKGKELVCKNPGTWQLTVQYQALNINSVDTGLDARLIGWFNINGKNVEDSSAVTYASVMDGTAVLTFALSSNFQLNDAVKFGIRSESSDSLNIVIADIKSGSNIVAPALTVSAVKVPSTGNFNGFEGKYAATGKVYYTNLKTGKVREEQQKIVVEISKIADGNFYCKFTELEPNQASFACIATNDVTSKNVLRSGTSGLNWFSKRGDDLLASWNFNFSSEEDQSASLTLKRLLTKNK